jgi:hypothetical protein
VGGDSKASLTDAVTHGSASLSPHIETKTGLSSKLLAKEVEMQAYCMKCREKVEINHQRSVKLQNGRVAIRGICFKCFNQVSIIVKPEIEFQLHGSIK